MKSPKNLLKKIVGGNYELTVEEYLVFRKEYFKFEIGDTVVYDGGIKFKQVPKKQLRRNFNPSEHEGSLKRQKDTSSFKWIKPDTKIPIKGKEYVVSNVIITKDPKIDFDNPPIYILLEGLDGHYSQDFFSPADESKKVVLDKTIVSSKLSISELTILMNECIEIENYERAAFYRDEIEKRK